MLHNHHSEHDFLSRCIRFMFTFCYVCILTAEEAVGKFMFLLIMSQQHLNEMGRISTAVVAYSTRTFGFNPLLCAIRIFHKENVCVSFHVLRWVFSGGAVA